MRDYEGKPSLEDIHLELKMTIGGLAVLINECLIPNSGLRMLGLEKDTYIKGEFIDLINLENINIAKNLSVYYAYAYEGIFIPGYEKEIHGLGDNLELLSDFFEIFKSDNAYFDSCAEAAGMTSFGKVKFGLVRDMINRLQARSDFDEGVTLSISQVALLANMNERSVKNATNADVDRLELNSTGYVENTVARSWLRNRRGFIPTIIKNYSQDFVDNLDDLSPVEIPAFIADRVIKIYAESDFDVVQVKQYLTSDNSFEFSYQAVIEKASSAANISTQELKDAITQPLKIKPEHIPNIAKCIHVDVVWFNLQVMRALYPSQVDMILNPTYFNNIQSSINESSKFIEIVLTENMIKHGYIDIPSFFKAFFPAQCCGSRSDVAQNLIKIIVGKSEFMTDVRIKSEKTISFRKRFGTWFRDIQVKPNDRISISKVGAENTNVYELTHLPKK